MRAGPQIYEAKGNTFRGPGETFSWLRLLRVWPQAGPGCTGAATIAATIATTIATTNAGAATAKLLAESLDRFCLLQPKYNESNNEIHRHRPTDCHCSSQRMLEAN